MQVTGVNACAPLVMCPYTTQYRYPLLGPTYIEFFRNDFLHEKIAKEYILTMRLTA